jgi:hypothetical protein
MYFQLGHFDAKFAVKNFSRDEVIIGWFLISLSMVFDGCKLQGISRSNTGWRETMRWRCTSVSSVVFVVLEQAENKICIDFFLTRSSEWSTLGPFLPPSSVTPPLTYGVYASYGVCAYDVELFLLYFKLIPTVGVCLIVVIEINRAVIDSACECSSRYLVVLYMSIVMIMALVLTVWLNTRMACLIPHIYMISIL